MQCCLIVSGSITGNRLMWTLARPQTVLLRIRRRNFMKKSIFTRNFLKSIPPAVQIPEMTSPIGNVLPKFRDNFHIATKDILRWFPGHMGKGIKQMQQKLKHIDCIIEVHDARVPLCGHYADFTKTLTGLKPHIFVLNKVDLIDKKLNNSIVEHLREKGLSHVLFTNLRNSACKGTEKLLPLAQQLIKQSDRYNRSQESSFQIMVIGIPNVGKSSLINRLRNNNLHKTSAVQVGAVAGITRSVLTKVKVSENPDIYILDTPGILSPKIDDMHTGLKLALVGCMQDHLVGPEVLADYLLFWLNRNEKFDYVKKFGLSEPNDKISYILVYLAAKLKKTLRIKNYDGRMIEKPDLRYAAEYFISMFRKGDLGYHCLDRDLLYKLPIK